MRLGQLRDRLPLAVWAGGTTAFVALLSVATVAVALSVTGDLDGTSEMSLAGAGGVAAVSAAFVALGSRKHAAALRALREEAVRRLHDPSLPVRPARSDPRLKVGASAEITQLARTLDALHLRLRMADDLAQRHRRTAETASAGMFELLSGLVEAEEGARGQLAAELHDTVAQALAAARSLLADGTAIPDDVARAAELVAEAEDQLRAVMARTRPPALRDGDLAAAVALLRDDLFARYGLAVRLEWPVTAHPLPLATAITVYRFFQEALLNVVKHAEVDDAVASLRIDGEQLMATVRDAGPGFDPDEVKSERGRHVGLGLLRERARLAGGALEVSSAPGQGTALSLRMPVAPGLSALPIQRTSIQLPESVE